MLRRTHRSLCAAVPTFAERVATLDQDWKTNPRWATCKRPYAAKDVVLLQGSRPPFDCYSAASAKKGWKLFNELQAAGDASVTFGALDPAQIVQMSKYAKSIYISGWQCSSTFTSSHEVGPDLADYPMDTVPKRVDTLRKALEFHDKKQFMMSGGTNGPCDLAPPIIADADTGHGGVTAVSKLTKMFVDAGAAGVHCEDQRHGAKKCGHMGGKVLCSVQEHVNRLNAIRLQSDIMGSPLMIVARTDAEAGSLIDSNIDARDHWFIQAKCPSGTPDKFINYHDAVLRVLNGDKDKIAKWTELTGPYKGQSFAEMRDIAQSVTGGSAPAFDVEAARTQDGFYVYQPGVEACIMRGRAFAPAADILWMETAKPGVALAKSFADGVAEFKKLLTYNLSPSFNWDKESSGMTDEQIKSFCGDLAKLGFCFQFITLAGFHGSALIADQVARNLCRQKNMLAYVDQIQRVERKEGVEVLKHQQWAGSKYMDALLMTVRGDASDIGIGAGTEAQFK